MWSLFIMFIVCHLSFLWNVNLKGQESFVFPLTNPTVAHKSSEDIVDCQKLFVELNGIETGTQFKVPFSDL